MAQVTMSLRIDEVLKAQIAAWAEADGRSANALIEGQLRTAVIAAKADMEGSAARAKATLETLMAVMGVAICKDEGHELTAADFEADSPEALWLADEKRKLEQSADDDWTPEDFMIDRRYVQEEMEVALFVHERHMKIMKALTGGKSAGADDLIDGNRHINKTGGEKIRQALKIRGMTNYDLCPVLGYTNLANGSNVLTGHKQISPRALRLLRDWIAETDDMKAEAKPKLAVVE